jgi:hypothetical protein
LLGLNRRNWQKLVLIEGLTGREVVKAVRGKFGTEENQQKHERCN